MVRRDSKPNLMFREPPSYDTNDPIASIQLALLTGRKSRVAGPWIRRMRKKWVRFDSAGHEALIVECNTYDGPSDKRWFVRSGTISPSGRPNGTFKSVADAMSVADRWFSSRGWILLFKEDIPDPRDIVVGPLDRF